MAHCATEVLFPRFCGRFHLIAPDRNHPAICDRTRPKRSFAMWAIRLLGKIKKPPERGLYGCYRTMLRGSRFFLFPPTRCKSQQAKTGKQHRVGFGFWNSGNRGAEKNPVFTDVSAWMAPLPSA